MTVFNKAEKIANTLFERIKSGELAGQLPSDKRVAEDFGVALMTATRALNLLQERGAVVRIPRKGTFVLGKSSSDIRIKCLPRFFEIFRQYLAVHHPEYNPVLVRDRGEKWDLCVMTTYSIFTAYDAAISQFAKSREQRLRQSGRFWDQVCELYSKNNHLYGVPYLLSPILLHYNRTLMREICADFDPVEMDMNEFFRLLEKAAAKGYGGVDLHCFGPAFFFNMVYCLAGHAPDEASILTAGAYFEKLIAHGGEPFTRGRTLFALSPRHQNYEVDFQDYDVAPLPFINGRRACPLASEALVVSSSCGEPEFLHELCEETLSPQFQRLVTADQYGVASDRSIAMESLKTSRRRDDFYITEIANSAVIFKDYSLEMVQDISLCIVDFRQGDISAAEFTAGLREALARQKRAEKRKKRFLEMHASTEFANAGEITA